eukprot:GEMP01012279.1.p1 GENE.GEMP01012279.1~~GEMP01012279.1.p1  ORF type:complete len:576 (+),score=131.66 GEMP01012279.1:81-1808(+)
MSLDSLVLVFFRQGFASRAMQSVMTAAAISAQTAGKCDISVCRAALTSCAIASLQQHHKLAFDLAVCVQEDLAKILDEHTQKEPFMRKLETALMWAQSFGIAGTEMLHLNDHAGAEEQFARAASIAEEAHASVANIYQVPQGIADLFHSLERILQLRTPERVGTAPAQPMNLAPRQERRPSTVPVERPVTDAKAPLPDVFRISPRRVSKFVREDLDAAQNKLREQSSTNQRNIRLMPTSRAYSDKVYFSNTGQKTALLRANSGLPLCDRKQCLEEIIISRHAFGSMHPSAPTDLSKKKTTLQYECSNDVRALTSKIRCSQREMPMVLQLYRTHMRKLKKSESAAVVASPDMVPKKHILFGGLNDPVAGNLDPVATALEMELKQSMGEWFRRPMARSRTGKHDGEKGDDLHREKEEKGFITTADITKMVARGAYLPLMAARKRTKQKTDSPTTTSEQGSMITVGGISINEEIAAAPPTKKIVTIRAPRKKAGAAVARRIDKTSPSGKHGRHAVLDDACNLVTKEGGDDEDHADLTYRFIRVSDLRRGKGYAEVEKPHRRAGGQGYLTYHQMMTKFR